MCTIYDDRARLDDYCALCDRGWSFWLVIAYFDKVKIAFETLFHESFGIRHGTL
jgi:hypothetical protein